MDFENAWVHGCQSDRSESKHTNAWSLILKMHGSQQARKMLSAVRHCAAQSFVTISLKTTHWLGRTTRLTTQFDQVERIDHTLHTL